MKSLIYKQIDTEMLAEIISELSKAERNPKLSM